MHNVISARALENGGFFFTTGPRQTEVNRHFLENDNSDLSFFSVVLNWVVNFSV